MPICTVDLTCISFYKWKRQNHLFVIFYSFVVIFTLLCMNSQIIYPILTNPIQHRATKRLFQPPQQLNLVRPVAANPWSSAIPDKEPRNIPNAIIPSEASSLKNSRPKDIRYFIWYWLEVYSSERGSLRDALCVCFLGSVSFVVSYAVLSLTFFKFVKICCFSLLTKLKQELLNAKN